MKKEIPVTEFKAHCLRLLTQVARTGGELTITKRGKPLATVSAPRKRRSLVGTLRFNAPLKSLFSADAEWELG